MDRRFRYPNILNQKLEINGSGLRLQPGSAYVIMGTLEPILQGDVWYLSVSTRMRSPVRVLGWDTWVNPAGTESGTEFPEDAGNDECISRASSGTGVGPPALLCQDSIPGVDDCRWGASMLPSQSHQKHQSEADAHGGNNTDPGSCCDITGFFDIGGGFHSCAPPSEPETVKSWLSRWTTLPWEHVWLSCDGSHIGLDTVLGAFQQVLIRVRAKLRGGGSKKDGFDKADTDKLKKHLLGKGVPESLIDARVNDVLQVVSPAQLSDIYRSLEPWVALKAAVKQRVRLVTAEEMKQHKARSKTSASSVNNLAHDPWTECDPWQQSRNAGSSAPPTHPPRATIELLSEFFCNEDGTHPNVISEVENGCSGVCLMTSEQVEMLTSFGTALSDQECAAVVIGTISPQVGAFSCEEITVVAQHSEAGRVLLKGFLVNLGDKQLRIQPDDDIISVAPKNTEVVTVEVVEQYCREWSSIRNNPLRFAFKSIDGLQAAVTSSWSRRFFKNKVACSPDEATSFHAFAKVLQPELQKLLRQSGVGGVFLTPKNTSGDGPSSNFRIVWGEGNDLEKALIAARANPAVCGVVRGKGNLGWRVQVKEYARYDVATSCMYVASPMPVDFDREAVQAALTSFAWDAIPLRQLNAHSWLIGSDGPPPKETLTVQGTLVLLREESRKSKSKPESAVVAAPARFRRALDDHILTANIAAQSSAPAVQTSRSSVKAPFAATPPQIDALRAEFEERLGEVNAQVQDVICQVQKANTESKTAQNNTTQKIGELQEVCSQQQARLQAVELGVQTMAASMCTKEDLSSVLATALAQQSSELRSWLSKRTPDASPSHEPQKSAKHA
ncbi:hypothetical protein AK812_SmicGene2884 [Symbiodinium microadriaticum]|uniref:Uncharacterized protein n=1 Tax=Symbiodinium microadriaticum TaxID=2951 RepID=A0A1Q9F0D9_SYMMI|nr:hypothetical protein AK812_SmicGene2884 [Symbiodinium microadriaticum]CAE7348164.1 unnamed protein product [Symbiodinium sp. KB8]